MNKQWRVLPDPPQSFYDEHPELPVVVARLLYHRNIRSQEEMDEFLNPEYTTSIHDPFLFQDMEKATDRIFLAIKNDEHIVIHGDYDADGVCSSSILTITLRALGAKHIDVFLPHRETDGYGLNTNTIEKLHEKGTHLIITCDCGELELQTKGNNHKINGNFGDYYCVNPQKRIIIGDRVKVITVRNVIDDCYAEIYHWEKLDTIE